MENFEYDNLIKNWHIKAEEDYFARFSFEFLSFIAFAKNHIMSKSDIMIATNKTDEGKITDRDYIQALKQNVCFKNSWIDLVNRNHQQLSGDLNKLINELQDINLLSERDWWDCSDFNSQNKLGSYADQGLIRGDTDYVNLIEVWYVVRNTLFHGNKNPERERDRVLVEYCYKTLSVFMGKVALPYIEKAKNKLYPAIWEDFFKRFLDGNAEVNDGSGRAANVYELSLLDDSKFPFFIGEKEITKQFLIDEINIRLAITTDDNYRDKIFQLNNSAHNKEQKELVKKYFGETIRVLEELWGKIN